MLIEFDPNKSKRNKRERGLSFDQAIDLDWEGATIIEDTRNDYPEPRYVAIGYLDKRLHVVCFTPIDGGIRVISFRKANNREANSYGKPINR